MTSSPTNTAPPSPARPRSASPVSSDLIVPVVMPPVDAASPPASGRKLHLHLDPTKSTDSREGVLLLLQVMFVCDPDPFLSTLVSC